MPSIEWSDRWRRDLNRLHDFLVEKSPNSTLRAVRAILKGERSLGDRPQIGRRLDGLPPEYRELVVKFGRGAYVVFYSFNGSRALILAILHGREVSF